MKKLIKIVFIILMLIIVFTQNVKADDATGFSFSSIWEAGKQFISSGQKSQEGELNTSAINSLSKTILSILQIIAIGLALIMAAILGIKYMAGSVEQKAEIKKTLIPYMVGCVVAFGAFTIWKIILELLEGINV